MKKVIDRASSRGYFNHGWLKTHHTFSFANYYNPERIHFGALRVLNDDSVDPSMGFDTHPHKNMEVISIPLKGYLKHGDSVQNTKTITPGDIQVMSTGSGIYHSEYNGSDKEQLEFLQIWVFPRVENTKPEYNNFDIRPLLKPNELVLILSPNGKTPASIKQDAWSLWEVSIRKKQSNIRCIRKVTGYISSYLKEKSQWRKNGCPNVMVSVFGIQKNSRYIY